MEKGFHAFNQASLRKRLEESQALIEEGFKLQQQGHFESASARFEAALVLSPGHPTALQLLGLIAKHQGDLARARSLMQRSLQTNPKQAHVWNNLSNIYLESGDVTASLHAIDEALRRDNGFAYSARCGHLYPLAFPAPQRRLSAFRRPFCVIDNPLHPSAKRALPGASLGLRGLQV
ncbi:MAG: hypothetical protein EBX56_08535 [Betaproteobacteria bacterium]|nr:hypothetical protein [Betaproteobacteria bacterium]